MGEKDWSLHDLLRSMGLNRTYQGYKYLVYILEMARREPERLELVTKRVYPDVARAFDVTPASVDSALRTAARACWKWGPEGVFVRPDEKKKPPTVSQFLRQLAQEDRRREAGER